MAHRYKVFDVWPGKTLIDQRINDTGKVIICEPFDRRNIVPHDCMVKLFSLYGFSKYAHNYYHPRLGDNGTDVEISTGCFNDEGVVVNFIIWVLKKGA